MIGGLLLKCDNHEDHLLEGFRQSTKNPKTLLWQAFVCCTRIEQSIALQSYMLIILGRIQACEQSCFEGILY